MTIDYEAIIRKADKEFRECIDNVFSPIFSDTEGMDNLYKESMRDDNDPINFMHRLELKSGFEIRNVEDIYDIDDNGETRMSDEDSALLHSYIFTERKYEGEELENFDIITVWYSVEIFKYYPQNKLIHPSIYEFPMLILLHKGECIGSDPYPENYIDETIWEEL